MKPTFFDRIIMWILDRVLLEPYVYKVREMERNKMTYLPDINGNYGPRQMEHRDRAGRWSTGWRSTK